MLSMFWKTTFIKDTANFPIISRHINKEKKSNDKWYKT